jgi:hypothetical protein
MNSGTVGFRDQANILHTLQILLIASFQILTESMVVPRLPSRSKSVATGISAGLLGNGLIRTHRPEADRLPRIHVRNSVDRYCELQGTENCWEETMDRHVPSTTQNLTAAQRSLLRIIRENRFGRIENLRIQDGQPVFDGAVKVVRVARLGGESGTTTVPSSDECELKQAIRDLFEELARLRDGEIVRLEFRHGLPFLLETVARTVSDEPGNPAAIRR